MEVHAKCCPELVGEAEPISGKHDDWLAVGDLDCVNSCFCFSMSSSCVPGKDKFR